MRVRKKKPPTRPHSAIDVAWAAGIYEGEGNCDGRRNRTTEVVNVTQKGRWILYRIAAFWGGTIWTNKRQVSRWYLTGQDARNFMAEIWPYLSPRRKAQWRFCTCVPKSARFNRLRRAGGQTVRKKVEPI